MPVPRVLSIAGSDSGGGAGIQADLKAIAACRAHGMTAITAITAQNTVAVTRVHQVPGEVIVAQVRAVVEDIGVDAVKVGMLGDEETIEAVAAALDLIGPDVPVVLDPVMVAESGAELLRASARRALVGTLFPRTSPRPGASSRRPGPPDPAERRGLRPARRPWPGPSASSAPRPSS
jgi:hydroxymethylpyrimidine/phosphomethylpyrimidine kinase